MAGKQPLQALSAGERLIVGGDQVVTVPAELAEKFRAGDSLFVLETTGELLHVPAKERLAASEAVAQARAAFEQMAAVGDEAVSAFFEEFAKKLEDEEVWGKILAANESDVAAAKAKGRSTNRLAATEKVRKSMAAGLRAWIPAQTRRGAVLERLEHEGWSVELTGAALGVVGFVFEGRPNVLADATGVLRGGNTVVLRIGSDALGTARTMAALALEPALKAAGLPPSAVRLVDSTSHAAGWALMSDRRLALAVARGSGPTVAALGLLAKQAGVPASLHGTGGAWMFAGRAADAARLAKVAEASLDRKVCNTLNVVCVVKERAAELLRSLLLAGEPRDWKLHVVAGDEQYLPEELRARRIDVARAEGVQEEAQVEALEEKLLAKEWEWEQTPELSLKVVEDAAEAARLFNAYSPQFVASCVSEDEAEQEAFFKAANAPFFGDGFTRWVDGQYALNRPELGLSNWENGRLFGRGGILSGESVYTVRTRVRQSDAALHR